MTFKQFCVICLLINYSAVTWGSFNYAYFTIEKQITAGETVLVLGALQGLTTALLGYAFKLLHGD